MCEVERKFNCAVHIHLQTPHLCLNPRLTFLNFSNLAQEPGSLVPWFPRFSGLCVSYFLITLDYISIVIVSKAWVLVSKC